MPDPTLSESITMSEDTTAPSLPLPPARSLIAKAALLVALLALAATVWQWLDNRQQERILQQALTDKLSEFGESNREIRVVASHAEEVATRYSAKIAVLEEKLQASSAHQEALQTLYEELASNRGEWAIAEVEQLLITASQQLQLASNVKPALLALQTADSRLQQLNKPQIIPLRKAIEQDIQRLQAVPQIDTVGMSLKLSSLAETVDQLPLVSERHPKEAPSTEPDWDSRRWHRLSQEIWRDIRRMVRIERVDQPEPPLLAPEQIFFLRENLRLRLLTARVALLQHDDASYRADLRQAENWLKRHFDTQDIATRVALDTLQQLASIGITIDIPNISASLNAISQYKLGQEKAHP
jgi:uroporphyrin-3 C-methyltransferase